MLESPLCVVLKFFFGVVFDDGLSIHIAPTAHTYHHKNRSEFID